MNKVVAFLFGLVCFSSQSFAATVPKPYVPDEPVMAVKPKPSVKPATKTVSVVKRIAKKPLSVAKTSKIKPSATKPVKLAQTTKAVKTKIVKKSTVTKIALNSTQRLNKYSRVQKNKSRQLAQHIDAKPARIASRAYAPVKTSPVASPTRVTNIPLTSGSPFLDSSSALVMNANTGRMIS